MRVVDLFAGVGGFTFGSTQAGAEVALAIESDPHIARVYKANHGDHVRVQTLGGNIEALGGALDGALVAELRRYDHLHGSPPCQRLSRANQTSRDATAGLELVHW